MSTSQLLLVVAILVTFVMWRRVRRENQRLRAEADAHAMRHSYTLEPAETDTGRGYTIRDAEEREIDASSLEWEREGLLTVDLPQPAADVRPGQQVQFAVMEPGRVEVLLDDDALLGTLAGSDAAQVERALEQQELADALVLWQATGGALTLLLVHAAVVMEP